MASKATRRRRPSVSGSPSAAEDFRALLLRIEQEPDADLSLEALAGAAGCSPFQFHRRFLRAVGETPRRHVERVRLERAAYLVAVTEDPIVDIGLAVGFHSHETFSRAFHRRFGRPPRDYRRAAQQQQNARAERNRAFRGDGCSLSEVRFTVLRPTWLLAVHRIGPYGAFRMPPFGEQDDGWRPLADWAAARGIVTQGVAWGFYPSDPGLTPPDQQRSEVCLPIGQEVGGDERVRCVRFEGGPYAVIGHLGPYETMDQAYRGCADGIRRSSQYVFAEGAPLQIFRAAAIGEDPDLNHCEICFPVRRRR